MCFSTILKDDGGPTQTDPFTAAACGSVGIVACLKPQTSLIAAHHQDGGSSGRTWGAGCGSSPTAESCANSILLRENGHNEWFLSDAQFIGIFSFPNPVIFNPAIGERHYGLDRVVDDFPDERIFTSSGGQFFEFDRTLKNWLPCRYDEIVPEE